MAQSDPWSELARGDPLVVVKLAPDGSEAARYPGTVLWKDARDNWVIVQATWTYRRIELDGLAFSPGDTLFEWFSPDHDFNAFAVHAPDGALKGWYANVTYPARLDTREAPVLIWHDLYVDVVALPDGSVAVRDEDELAASLLEHDDPELYRRIVLARDELLRRFERRLSPFTTAVRPADR